MVTYSAENILSAGRVEQDGAHGASAGQADSRPAAGLPVDAAPQVDELFGTVYDGLKAMARRELNRSGGHTINTTSLVHELYLKICTSPDLRFTATAKFFGYAALAMRHILVDRANRRIRIKNGGRDLHIDLDDPSADGASMSPQLALQLDRALTALEKQDARAAKVVELHYFAGLSMDEVAELLGVVRRTIDRDWRYARAFMSAQVE